MPMALARGDGGGGWGVGDTRPTFKAAHCPLMLLPGSEGGSPPDTCSGYLLEEDPWAPCRGLLGRKGTFSLTLGRGGRRALF